MAANVVSGSDYAIRVSLLYVLDECVTPITVFMQQFILYFFQRIP